MGQTGIERGRIADQGVQAKGQQQNYRGAQHRRQSEVCFLLASISA
jgi:hypothetical protein